jgi:hypothetical protein
MSDQASEHVAGWFDDATPAADPPGARQWACVEIFGHRKHYGRISEVEKFGAKFLRVDVPSEAAAPLLGEAERFETFVYGGGAIFSVTPMTEDAARQWAVYERPERESALRRLPPPSSWDDEDEEVE